MMKPAKKRAADPVATLAVLDSFGRADDDDDVLSTTTTIEVDGIMVRRSLSSVVKYSADPKPVRSAEGRVPRHRPRTGWEEERMDFSVERSETVWWDCWTRVLRRSAGCSRMEEARPEDRPARKWNGAFDAAISQSVMPSEGERELYEYMLVVSIDSIHYSTFLSSCLCRVGCCCKTMSADRQAGRQVLRC